MQRSTIIGIGAGTAVLIGLWWYIGRRMAASTRAGRAVAAARAPRVKVKTSSRINAKDEVQIGRDPGPGVMFADDATTIAASSAALASMDMEATA